MSPGCYIAPASNMCATKTSKSNAQHAYNANFTWTYRGYGTVVDGGWDILFSPLASSLPLTDALNSCASIAISVQGPSRAGSTYFNLYKLDHTNRDLWGCQINGQAAHGKPYFNHTESYVYCYFGFQETAFVAT